MERVTSCAEEQVFSYVGLAFLSTVTSAKVDARCRLMEIYKGPIDVRGACGATRSTISDPGANG